MPHECNICLAQAREPVVARCGHLFCWACLHRWLDAPAEGAGAAAEGLAAAEGAAAPEETTPLRFRGAPGARGQDGRARRGASPEREDRRRWCPVCKVAVSRQTVVPTPPSAPSTPAGTPPPLARAATRPPRTARSAPARRAAWSSPVVPARPAGERPTPEAAAAAAMLAFAAGAVQESRTFGASDGYFPVLFGLNCQGSVLSEDLPPESRTLARLLIGLALVISLVVFML
ncbi:unnamed protein product [Prorocentrum cordatum]|uniref:RING-type E3 ubiquitin transferase n=1 Tax=Prorocentrum cordatum TaxID=2364126 RepID=A0ABN9UVQ0_9DINO|nr:unnamed protein product [Polarella glacialis]